MVARVDRSWTQVGKLRSRSLEMSWAGRRRQTSSPLGKVFLSFPTLALSPLSALTFGVCSLIFLCHSCSGSLAQGLKYSRCPIHVPAYSRYPRHAQRCWRTGSERNKGEQLSSPVPTVEQGGPTAPGSWWGAMLGTRGPSHCTLVVLL